MIDFTKICITIYIYIYICTAIDTCTYVAPRRRPNALDARAKAYMRTRFRSDIMHARARGGRPACIYIYIYMRARRGI